MYATGNCATSVVTEGHVIPCKCPCGVLYDVRILYMGTAQLVFAVVLCGDATGIHVTGSHVSHITGSDASHVHCPQVCSVHAQPEIVPYSP